MRYDYKKCPHCGASLDIGEACECQSQESRAADLEDSNPLTPDKVQFCKYPYRQSCKGCHHISKSWQGFCNCDMQTEQERIDWLLHSYKQNMAINAS